MIVEYIPKVNLSFLHCNIINPQSQYLIIIR